MPDELELSDLSNLLKLIDAYDAKNEDEFKSILSNFQTQQEMRITQNENNMQSVLIEIILKIPREESFFLNQQVREVMFALPPLSRSSLCI